MRHASALLLACLSACGIQRPEDGGPPVVAIETPGGTELGVNTDLGILFAGRTSQAGPCKLTVFFGATPVVENGEIQELRGGLYQTRTVARTASAPILMEHPLPGESLQLMGVRDGQVYTQSVSLAGDDDVSGNVLAVPSGFTPDQVGAPLFVERDGRRYLVGLVKALARLEGGDGAREFLVFSGLEQLRDAMLQRQPAVREAEVIYRDDEIRTLRDRK